MQNEPQDSPQVTPRLPIEGEPSECEQEVAESVVTAERMNGMVKTAKPRESDADVDGKAALGGEPAERAHIVDEGGRKIADVDRTALLGGEPAERARGVGEGDEMECDSESQLQQTIFYCQESCQRNENTNVDVPSSHGVLLEGEWTGCASGEASDPKSSENTSNAAVEHADGSYERLGLVNFDGVESEGCGGGTSADACVDKTDSSPGREVESMDTPNKSDTLVIVSIELEAPNGGGILHVRLGRTRLRACHADRLGNGADASRGRADELRGLADALNASNGAEIAGMSDGEGAGTYLGVRDAKRVVNATDGIGSRMDVLTRPTDVSSVEMDAYSTANMMEFVSTTPRRKKPPDSPTSTAKWTPDRPDGCRSHADASSARTDVQSVVTDILTTANVTEIVSIPRKWEKPPDSPMETAKCAPDKSNGLRDHAGTPNGCTDASCIGNAMKTTENVSETVRPSQNEQKLLNLPIETTRRAVDEPNGCTSHVDASSACTDMHCIGNTTEMAGNEADRVRTR